MIENTNTKQYYPGPILNNTLEITKFLFRDAEQIYLTKATVDETGKAVEVALTYGKDYEVLKVLPDDINVEDANLTASTGQIILKDTVTVNTGEKLVAYRKSALVQETAYPRTGSFPAASHEGEVDYLTMQNQEQQEQINRVINIPVSVSNFDPSLPIPVANKTIKINDTATGFVYSDYDPDEAVEITNKNNQESKEAADAAKMAEQNATESKTAAAASATQANLSATQAAASATQANQTLQNIVVLASETITNIEQVGEEQLTAIETEGTKQVNLAKDWAIKMDGKVNNEDYSSKYYASKAKEAEETATRVVQDIEEVTDEVLEEAKAQLNADAQIQINNVKNEGNTQVARVQAEGATQVANIKATGIYVDGDDLYYTTEDGETKKFEGGKIPNDIYTEDGKLYYTDATGATQEFQLPSSGVMNYGMSLYTPVDPKNPGLLKSQGQRNSGDIYKGIWEDYLTKKTKSPYWETWSGDDSRPINEDTGEVTLETYTNELMEPAGWKSVDSITLAKNCSIRASFYLKTTNEEYTGTTSDIHTSPWNVLYFPTSIIPFFTTLTPCSDIITSENFKAGYHIFYDVETKQFGMCLGPDNSSSEYKTIYYSTNQYEYYKPYSETIEYKIEFESNIQTEGYTSSYDLRLKVYTKTSSDTDFVLSENTYFSNLNWNNISKIFNKNSICFWGVPEDTNSATYNAMQEYGACPYVFNKVTVKPDAIQFGVLSDSSLALETIFPFSEKNEETGLYEEAGKIEYQINTDVNNIKDINDETFTEYDWRVDLATTEFILPTLNGSENIGSTKILQIETKSSNEFYDIPANGELSVQGAAKSNNNWASLYIWRPANKIAEQRTENVQGSGLNATLRVYRNDRVRIDYINMNTPEIIFMYYRGNGDLYFYVGDFVKNQGEIDAAEVLNTLATKTDKAQAAHAAIPDWESAVSTPLTTLTLPYDAAVLCYAQVKAYQQFTVMVEGSIAAGVTNSTNALAYFYTPTFNAEKGSVITVNTEALTANTLTIRYIPLKGAIENA